MFARELVPRLVRDHLGFEQLSQSDAVVEMGPGFLIVFKGFEPDLPDEALRDCFQLDVDPAGLLAGPVVCVKRVVDHVHVETFLLERRAEGQLAGLEF